ncbi:MAG: hypothetical protein Q7R83_01615 [bacterium]|nr:hypothetical protein [bacterium]
MAMQKGKTVALIIVSVLLVASLGGNLFLYVRSTPKQVAAQSDQEVARVVEQVGRLMVLPTDETPTIATVLDPEKLKDQPFFANAKEGDRVLVYAKAKRVILFRSSENRIVEVAPL